MRVEFDRVNGWANISQPKYADKLSELGITKGAITPALGDFQYEDDNDELLDAVMHRRNIRLSILI